MNQLERLAERGSERGASTVFERASHGPATRDTSRVGVVALAAIVAVVAGLVAFAVRDAAGPENDLVADAPPPSPLFGVETGVVLVFDDGLEAVSALDLDTGAIVRREIGNRAGDQLHRLQRTGDHLVVGWGEIRSVPIDGGTPLTLGQATYSVPAAEDGSVWLVTYEGGRVGTGAATTTRVDVTDGHALEGPRDVPDGVLPLRGVVGGMAYESGDGVVVLDGDGVEVARLGTLLGDVHGALAAYCDSAAACIEGHIRDLETGTDVTFSASDPGYAIDIAGSRFSPDGTTLAVQTGPEIVLVDVATGRVTTAVPDALGDSGYLGWSDDGTQLFWSSYSYGSEETRVGRYDVTTGEHQRRDLDVGGFLSFVAVPRDVWPHVDDAERVGVVR